MHRPIDLAAPYGATPRGFQAKNIFVDQARLLGPARTIVDVGAHFGDELPTYLTLFPDAAIHAFEPTPSSALALRAEYGEHPRIQVHEVALAESEGSSDFYMYTQSEINSLTPYVPAPSRAPAGATEPDQISVTAWTLDAFCRRAGIGRIDLLKLDVQGAEQRVLNGASALLSAQRIGLLALEVLFVPLYRDQAEVEDLLRGLKTHGYNLYDFYNFSYGEDGQVLFGDAIFLPSSSRSRFG